MLTAEQKIDIENTLIRVLAQNDKANTAEIARRIIMLADSDNGDEASAAAKSEISDFERFYGNSGLPSILIDSSGSILIANKSFEIFSGYGSYDFEALAFDAIFEQNRGMSFADISKHFAMEISNSLNFDSTLIKKDKSAKSVVIGVSVLKQINLSKLKFIIVLTDKSLVKYLSDSLSRREKTLSLLISAFNSILCGSYSAQTLQKSLEYFSKSINIGRTFVNYVHHDPVSLEPLFSTYSSWSSEESEKNFFNPLTKSVPFRAFIPTLFESLQNKESFQATASQYSANLKMILHPQGILALYISPIICKNELWGFIAFEDFITEREFTPTEKSLIDVFSRFLENVIEEDDMKNQLISSKDEAEQAGRLKASFLANMSHELRTPMSGILGYADILRDELDLPFHRSMAENILKSGQRLMNTLNSILDLSSLDTNELVVNFMDMDITKIVKRVVPSYDLDATSKGVKIVLDMPDSAVIARVDERMFGVIVNHLVSNAVKFTDTGEIAIKVEYQSQNEQIFASISVADTGIGIAEKKKKMIFQEFRQASEGFARRNEGLGIGLTIVSKLVRLMNGAFFLDSEEGKGSTFAIRFLVVENDLFAEDSLSEKGELHSVLLVEDDEISRQVIKTCLRNICTLDIARDGDIAMKMVSQKQYRVILMDINLGRGINGLEVTRNIRTISNYAKTPIVAVTAFAMQGDKEEFMAAGCSHYISKPFEKVTLVNLVKQFI